MSPAGARSGPRRSRPRSGRGSGPGSDRPPMSSSDFAIADRNDSSDAQRHVLAERHQHRLVVAVDDALRRASPRTRCCGTARGARPGTRVTPIAADHEGHARSRARARAAARGTPACCFEPGRAGHRGLRPQDQVESGPRATRRARELEVDLEVPHRARGIPLLVLRDVALHERRAERRIRRRRELASPGSASQPSRVRQHDHSASALDQRPTPSSVPASASRNESPYTPTHDASAEQRQVEVRGVAEVRPGKPAEEDRSRAGAPRRARPRAARSTPARPTRGASQARQRGRRARVQPRRPPSPPHRPDTRRSAARRRARSTTT